MVKKIHFAIGFTVLNFMAATQSGAQPLACEALKCDCGAMPTKALEAACSLRETKLQGQCSEVGIAATDFCTFSGVAANRLAGYAEKAKASKKTVSALEIKWSATRDVMAKNLKRFEQHVTFLEQSAVIADLRQLESNIDQLQNIQTKLAKKLEKAGAPDLARQSWRQFSILMADTATSIDISREDLEVQSAPLEHEITATRAALFEQAGYGFGLAGMHDDAVKYWKKSADTTSMLVVAAIGSGDTKAADQYRYLRSTRLHRARENWNKIEHN